MTQHSATLTGRLHRHGGFPSWCAPIPIHSNLTRGRVRPAAPPRPWQPRTALHSSCAPLTTRRHGLHAPQAYPPLPLLPPLSLIQASPPPPTFPCTLPTMRWRCKGSPRWRSGRRPCGRPLLCSLAVQPDRCRPCTRALPAPRAPHSAPRLPRRSRRERRPVEDQKDSFGSSRRSPHTEKH